QHRELFPRLAAGPRDQVRYLGLHPVRPKSPFVVLGLDPRTHAALPRPRRKCEPRGRFATPNPYPPSPARNRSSARLRISLNSSIVVSRSVSCARNRPNRSSTFSIKSLTCAVLVPSAS